MSNDPFKNFKPLNNAKGTPKRPSAPAGDSFVEQIKSIGSSAVNSLKTDVVKGTAQSIFDQLVGGAKSSDGAIPKDQDTSAMQDWIKSREQQAREEGRNEEKLIQAHRRSQEKVLFSFADEKLRGEINEVRQEIAMLVKTMGKVEEQIEQAVMQEVVDPGVYHLNFFRNLKTWIRTLRRSLQDASLWMETSAGRGKRSHYWNQAKRSGTKYTMSSERNVQMGAG